MLKKNQFFGGHFVRALAAATIPRENPQRKKKRAKFWAPHPSGPHFFWVWAHHSSVTTLSGFGTSILPSPRFHVFSGHKTSVHRVTQYIILTSNSLPCHVAQSRHYVASSWLPTTRFALATSVFPRPSRPLAQTSPPPCSVFVTGPPCSPLATQSCQWTHFHPEDTLFDALTQIQFEGASRRRSTATLNTPRQRQPHWWNDACFPPLWFFSGPSPFPHIVAHFPCTLFPTVTPGSRPPSSAATSALWYGSSRSSALTSHEARSHWRTHFASFSAGISLENFFQSVTRRFALLTGFFAPFLATSSLPHFPSVTSPRLVPTASHSQPSKSTFLGGATCFSHPPVRCGPIGLEVQHHAWW